MLVLDHTFFWSNFQPSDFSTMQFFIKNGSIGKVIGISGVPISLYTSSKQLLKLYFLLDPS